MGKLESKGDEDGERVRSRRAAHQDGGDPVGLVANDKIFAIAGDTLLRWPEVGETCSSAKARRRRGKKDNGLV